ncbi:MAG TPA: hypothetical protein PKD58_08055 [Candidatus Sumerlaeota bacterium]|nr:hypothetical protein [Candidatus Sumerlaeota bacterium]HMZ52080.1 hypothetical protein [Candidatus Sumerlaeota bacterium]
MQFLGKEEHYLMGLSLEELKAVHLSMWNDLKARKMMGVDETASDLLYELQMILQKEAQRQGVDIGIHSEWAAWAGLDTSCDVPRKNQGSTPHS